ncbi:DUF4214 domain-containing protein [Paracidovorax citrulli]
MSGTLLFAGGDTPATYQTINTDAVRLSDGRTVLTHLEQYAGDKKTYNPSGPLFNGMVQLLDAENNVVKSINILNDIPHAVGGYSVSELKVESLKTGGFVVAWTSVDTLNQSERSTHYAVFDERGERVDAKIIASGSSQGLDLFVTEDGFGVVHGKGYQDLSLSVFAPDSGGMYQSIGQTSFGNATDPSGTNGEDPSGVKLSFLNEFSATVLDDGSIVVGGPTYNEMIMDGSSYVPAGDFLYKFSPSGQLQSFPTGDDWQRLNWNDGMNHNAVAMTSYPGGFAVLARGSDGKWELTRFDNAGNVLTLNLKTDSVEMPSGPPVNQTYLADDIGIISVHPYVAPGIFDIDDQIAFTWHDGNLLAVVPNAGYGFDIITISPGTGQVLSTQDAGLTVPQGSLLMNPKLMFDGAALDITYDAVSLVDGYIKSSTYQIGLDPGPVNDVPQVQAVAEITLTDTASDDQFGPIFGKVQATDADGIKAYGIVGGGTGYYPGAGKVFDVAKQGAYGTLYLDSVTGDYQYTPHDLKINKLKSDATDSFTLTATDNNLVAETGTTVLKVSLTGANDTPVLTTMDKLGPATEELARTVSYAELLAASNATDADGDIIQFVIDKVGPNGTLLKSGSPVVQGVTTLGPGESLQWQPASDLAGSDIPAFTVVAFDGQSRTGDPMTVHFDVTNINDAPTLQNSAPVNFPQMDEGTTSLPFTVASILASASYDDADTGNMSGIAVSGTTGAGRWEYSVDGNQWTNVGSAPIVGYGLLLSATTQVRYVASGESGEQAQLSFVGWDGTSGKASGNLRVHADLSDTGGTTAFSNESSMVQVSVRSVNDAPSLIQLSTDTVAENSPTGAALAVGTLTAIDPDTGDTHTFSIAGGADAHLFELAGNLLLFKTGTVLDYESTPEFSVTIRGTDAGGLYRDQTITIRLTDVNEAPVVRTAIGDQTVAAGSAFSFQVPTETFEDPDAGQQLTYTATLEDGGLLPAWLSFDEKTRTFSGTPSNEDASVISVRVRASDNGSPDLWTDTVFDLTVRSGPIVTAITRTGDEFTAADSVEFAVSFSEPVQGVDISDFTLIGADGAVGTIANAVDRDGVHYVRVDNVNGDGTLKLVLNASGTGIVNGNGVEILSGYTAGQSYTIDNTAPTNTVTSMVLSSDSGLAGDFITSAAAQTISGMLAAELAANEFVQVSLDDGKTWTNATATTGDTTWTLAGVVLSGSDTLVVRVADIAGHAGEQAEQVYTIDTSAPQLDIAASTPGQNPNKVAINGVLTIRFDEAIHSSSQLGSVRLMQRGETDSVVDATVTLNDKGELEIQPASPLEYSTSYYVVWNTGALSDAAGNVVLGVQDDSTLGFTTAAKPVPQPPVPPVIDDNDGISEAEEDAAPGLPGPDGTIVAGDGNGDGIADSEQANVSSAAFLHTDTAQSNPDGAAQVYVTLVADSNDGKSAPGAAAGLRDVLQLDAPSDAPSDLDMPLGLIAFKTDVAQAGASLDFSLYVDGDIAVNGYWKQNAAGEWVNLASAAYGGEVATEGGKTRLDFRLQDGGEFDSDGVADGVITDPGAIGFRAPLPADPADTDDDQFPDALEGDHGLQVGTKDNDVFTSSKFFVMQLYRDLLFREAEGEGLQYWQGRLDSGELSRAEIAGLFLDSQEFQDAAGGIARLYFGALQRLPDNGGMEHWMSQAQAGQTLSEIAEAFAAGSEFEQRYGELDNAAFVQAMYQDVFGREADADGARYWEAQLDGGRSRAGALLGFTESAEYLDLSDDGVTVALGYVGLLGRTPEQAGYDYWLGQLGQGMEEVKLIGAFIGADEYHDRFLPEIG